MGGYSGVQSQAGTGVVAGRARLCAQPSCCALLAQSVVLDLGHPCLSVTGRDEHLAANPPAAALVALVVALSL